MMLRTSKRSMLSLLMAFVALFGTACSRFLSTPEPVTITFVHHDDVTGAYEQWAQQFQELHPYITIELKSWGPGVQGAEADAFVTTQFELPAYIQRGQVLDLSTFVEQDEDVDLSDFYGAALDTFSSQGRQWALPFGIDMMVLYYNMDLFDRYGAPYPTTEWDWGGFLDRALATTDVDGDIYGYALQYDGDFGAFEPLMFIYQAGGHVFDSLQSPTQATLDEPENIEAMEFYAGLIYDHNVAPTPEQRQHLGRPYPWRGVLEERFAMWATMFSDRGGQRWPMAWEMAWGMAPMPRNQTSASFATADGLFISAASEHPDAAWTWIEFLSTKMHPTQMPARRSLLNSTEYEEAVGIEVATTARAALEDAMLVNPELMGFEAVVAAIVEAFEQIRSGGVTPEIALEQAQQKAQF